MPRVPSSLVTTPVWANFPGPRNPVTPLAYAPHSGNLQALRMDIGGRVLVSASLSGSLGTTTIQGLSGGQGVIVVGTLDVRGLGTTGSGDTGLVTVQGISGGGALNVVGTVGIVGIGTAGTPAGGVASIQGVSGGTAQRIVVLAGTSGAQPAVIAGDVGIPEGIAINAGTARIGSIVAIGLGSGTQDISVVNLGSGANTIAAAATRRYLLVHNQDDALNIGLCILEPTVASADVGSPRTITLLPGGSYVAESGYIPTNSFTVVGTSGRGITIIQGLAP